MTQHKTEESGIPIELFKASQACGSSLALFSDFLEKKLDINATEATWVLAFFLSSMPQCVNDNPSLEQALRRTVIEVRQKLKDMEKGNNEGN